MTTRTKVILGLIGAAAAGAMVGILLAPDKGTEVRRRIGRTAGDWADHLTDLFANAKGELETMRTKAAKGADKVANKYSNMKEKFS